MKLLASIAGVILLMGLCACGGSVGLEALNPQTYFPPENTGLFQPIGGFPVSYAVYVEELRIPETIVEGQPFQITAKVSAQFRPIVLQGNLYWHQHGVFTGQGITLDAYSFPIDRVPEDEGLDHDVELTLGTGVVNPPGSGPVRDEFVFDCPGLPAGRQLVRYFTVTERRFGGVGAPQAPPESSAMLGDPEYYTSTVVVEVPIEVLPTPQAG